MMTALKEQTSNDIVISKGENYTSIHEIICSDRILEIKKLGCKKCCAENKYMVVGGGLGAEPLIGKYID